MTGNELFDMYSLNSGTADFFKINFNQKVSSLLTFGLTKRFKNAFRKKFGQKKPQIMFLLKKF